MKLICAGLTDVGMARDHNEDDLYLSEGNEPLCIVADGMGGHNSGEVASAMAIRAIVDYYRETIPKESDGYGQTVVNGEEIDLNQHRLTEALKTANRVVFEAAEGEEAFDGMGTTIVSGYFTERGLYMAHIGDSRAYRFRDGQLEQLTPDHSLANEYVRMGILAKEDVEFFPYKNVITRACGLAAEVEVDTSFMEYVPGDVYVLCTDGLTDMVSDEVIVEILEEESDVESACRQLVERANENGGNDNITVILAEVDEP